jgi:hypothetical protein
MLNRIFSVAKLQSCSTYSTMMLQAQCFGFAVSVVIAICVSQENKHGRGAPKEAVPHLPSRLSDHCQRAGKMHKSSG